MVNLNPAAEYAATARKYLEDSSRELMAQDYRQASEKLWGAVSQAVMAVALRRGWDYESHRSMKNAATRLSEETGDSGLLAGFLAAEQFHVNFYHGGMEIYQITANLPLVHQFVRRMLELAEADLNDASG